MDEAPGRFAEIAHAFDLSVVAQAEPEGDAIDDLIAQAALFQSGHPILVVPYIQTAPFKLDRVAVLWDGSISATRAITGAMRIRGVNLESLRQFFGHSFAGLPANALCNSVTACAS